MDSNIDDDSQTLERHPSSFKRRNFHNGVEEPNRGLTNSQNGVEEPNRGPTNFHNGFEEPNGGSRDLDTAQGLEDQHCDPEVWNTLNNCFRQVQSVLDHNRVLIQLVNENHRSQLPHKLLKNVALIREINGNITKVASLYSDLSLNFSNLIRKTDSSKKDGVNDNELED